MIQDEIVRMARGAGLPSAWISETGVLKWSDLERFAALIAAAEREACAKVCDQIAGDYDGSPAGPGADNCAEEHGDRNEQAHTGTVAHRPHQNTCKRQSTHHG